jgi:putative addiction module CopG family antidote
VLGNETGVASGRFSNASEMVREALRLLEQREAEDRAKLEWLRSRKEIHEFMNQIHDEVSAEAAVEPKRG